jgi:excisionase family DNA binding protein
MTSTRSKVLDAREQAKLLLMLYADPTVRVVPVPRELLEEVAAGAGKEASASEAPLPAMGDLTVPEVAAVLKCSKSKARELIFRRELRGYKWGKSYRVVRCVLEQYIHAQRSANVA